MLKPGDFPDNHYYTVHWQREPGPWIDSMSCWRCRLTEGSWAVDWLYVLLEMATDRGNLGRELTQCPAGDVHWQRDPGPWIDSMSCRRWPLTEWTWAVYWLNVLLEMTTDRGNLGRGLTLCPAGDNNWPRDPCIFSGNRVYFSYLQKTKEPCKYFALPCFVLQTLDRFGELNE